MSRYYDYFGNTYKPHRVEIDDGVFELRTINGEEEFGCRTELVFTEKDSGKQINVDCRIHNITLFGVNGVACNMFCPQGDRRIMVHFYIDGKIVSSNAYITDDNLLYYAYDGELHCARSVYDNKVIIPKEKFADMGYRDSIIYHDGFFPFRQTKKNL